MQMNWDADLFLKCLDKLCSGVWFDKTSHILDSQDVGSHLLQFFCNTYIVLKAIFVTLWIVDIAGVAHCCLAQFSSLENCIYRNCKSLCIVETVEYSEEVDSTLCRLFYEFIDNVVRIVCISYCIGGSEEHLEQNVRNLSSELLKPCPWTFLKEPESNVEGSSTPHLHREEVRCQICSCICNPCKVVCSEPCCQQ